jgi:Flp pilus assembly pilin Flp
VIEGSYMRTLLSRRRRGERGAAAVEFALVVVPLLLILGGIVNFGMAFSQKLALDNAVRQAARAAVVETGTDPTTEAEASFNGTAIARQGEDVAIAFGGGITTCEDSDFGDRIQVVGTFESKFMFPWLVPGIPTSITWESTGEFQCEYS